MSERETGKWIPSDDRVAVELRLAVRAGDVAAIRRLLSNDAALASARLVGKAGGSGTPAPALPIGVGPVEVDRGPAAREH
jgi:hypothetical protein